MATNRACRHRLVPLMKLRLALFAFALPALLPALEARAAIAPVESARTPRGSLLLVQRDRTAPRVAISLVLRAGAADETVATAGWRRLLVDSMLQGTRDPSALGAAGEVFLSGARLRERVESLGGRLSAQVGDDAIELSISGPSQRTQALLDILMAVATQPRLGDQDIDRARRALVRGLNEESGASGETGAGAEGANSQFDASARALRRLEERLYRDAKGAPLAYALAPTGTLQSLSNLDSAQLRALFRQYFAPARRVLSITGDFDGSALRARTALLESGSEWSAAPEARPAFAPLPASPPLDVMHAPSPAASVFLSYPVNFEALSAKEAAALQVLAAALGESPRARLPQRLSNPRRSYGDMVPQPGVRDEAGLPFAAALSAQWVPRRLRGEFVLWAQTGPQQIEAVKNALLDEMRKVREGALSPDELRRAKNFTRGAYATDRELLRERASRLALEAARGSVSSSASASSWIAEVEALSASDVQQAARKYLQGYAVALVMPVN